jgi:hypothetical protein
MSYVRRLLFTEERVRAMFARMRSELLEQHLTHIDELNELRRELDAVRESYRELRDAVIAREKAEGDLALLQRDRERLEGKTKTMLH